VPRTDIVASALFSEFTVVVTVVALYENKVLVPLGYKAVALAPVDFSEWSRVVDHFREQWWGGNVIDEEGNRADWQVVAEMREIRRSDYGASLGLRVTPELKQALDHAAKEGDISQSLEAEWRLENSLRSDKQLMLVQGHGDPDHVRCRENADTDFGEVQRFFWSRSSWSVRVH
jgi:hypothetical protein